MALALAWTNRACSSRAKHGAQSAPEKACSVRSTAFVFTQRGPRVGEQQQAKHGVQRAPGMACRARSARSARSARAPDTFPDVSPGRKRSHPEAVVRKSIQDQPSFRYAPGPRTKLRASAWHATSRVKQDVKKMSSMSRACAASSAVLFGYYLDALGVRLWALNVIRCLL